MVKDNLKIIVDNKIVDQINYVFINSLVNHINIFQNRTALGWRLGWIIFKKLILIMEKPKMINFQINKKAMNIYFLQKVES